MRDSHPRSRDRFAARRGAGDHTPFDFSAEDEADEQDPVDLMSIRADDELLDALAAGTAGFSGRYDPQMEAGYTDDQQVLAMLAALSAEVDSEPLPELVSVEEASRAIVAGQRANRPRRRLFPVAAAATAVLALGGVAVAAGSAQPGDPLWGVSKVIDGNRAQSVEAAYQVDLALSAAQQALAQGKVAQARAALDSVAPELGHVDDQQRRDQLKDKSDNLRQVAEQTSEGQSVDTDENGSRRNRNRGSGNQSGQSQSNQRDLRRGDPSATDGPESEQSGSRPERGGNNPPTVQRPGPDNQQSGGSRPSNGPDPRRVDPRSAGPQGGGVDPRSAAPQGGGKPDGGKPNNGGVKQGGVKQGGGKQGGGKPGGGEQNGGKPDKSDGKQGDGKQGDGKQGDGKQSGDHTQNGGK